MEAWQPSGSPLLGRGAKWTGGIRLVGLNWVDDPCAGAAVYLHDDGTTSPASRKSPRRARRRPTGTTPACSSSPPSSSTTRPSSQPSGRGEYELPDAITALIADGHPACGLELTGGWRDVGTPEDYAAINAEPTSIRT